MNRRAFTLCAVALLAACHRDSSTAPVVAPTPKARPQVALAHGPTAAEMTTGMVEAATQGKSQAPVTLKFDLLQRPVQGQPLEIAIALLPETNATVASVEVTGTAGLQLAPGDNKFEFPTVEASQVYRRTIKVTPAAEGVHVVTLNVSLQHDQVAESRAFSLPIIAAPAGATRN